MASLEQIRLIYPHFEWDIVAGTYSLRFGLQFGFTGADKNNLSILRPTFWRLIANFRVFLLYKLLNHFSIKSWTVFISISFVLIWDTAAADCLILLSYFSAILDA